ncbi:nucleoid-associated protein [Echinicola rosea]|uniref:Nucleoid-associated protein n=1 Tax=Echinicola rosea TaxID=1807691 RepID=A0ABQ1V7C3_9BACT|nr:nucleoid-associated protein [Echinicola rosea]GGF42515.1 hypothetical protein GCM10011339_33740 [Echinicola rosea]
MKVYKFVIHEIGKEKNINEARPTYSDSLNRINQNIEDLVEKLNKGFKRDERVVRTEFDDSFTYIFQNEFGNYVCSKTDGQFFRFSMETIKEMVKIIQGVPFATGGYFVYTEYSLNDSNTYVGIFLVRDTEGVIFNKREDGKFTVNKTMVINTEKLAMAAKISLQDFEKKNDRYLNLAQPNTGTVSNYFGENWIGAKLVEKNNIYTESFLKLIKIVELPINNETSQKYEIDSFREEVFKFIEGNGKVVRLNEIGDRFWGNPEYLVDIVEENNLDISNEFKATSKINYLKKYEIKSGKLKVGFSLGDVNSGRVRIEEDDKIIIEYKPLRNKLDKLNLISKDN